MISDLIPYSKQTIDSDDVSAVVRVLKSTHLTQGANISLFEEGLKKITNSKFMVAVSSGTAALHAACFAASIQEEDEVITTPLTFAASSNCILYTGAIPVFADIDEYGLLNPDEVAKKITRKTKAILTVDYAGQPSHLLELKRIAARRKLVLIEDAAHSLGATYRKQPVGTIADLTCFSFHPVKLITTGEGGAVSTNNQKFYKRLQMFRSHGITKIKSELVKPYEGPWHQEMHELGYNYRITDIQAALGVSQLGKAASFIKRRSQIADFYNKELTSLEEQGVLKLPVVTSDRTCAWHLYALRVNFEKSKYNKYKLFESFRNEGVVLQVHYPPVHLHPYYIDKFGYKNEDFPQAELFYYQEVSLPLYPTLSSVQAEKVVELTKKYIIPVSE